MAVNDAAIFTKGMGSPINVTISLLLDGEDLEAWFKFVSKGLSGLRVRCEEGRLILGRDVE